MSKSKSVEKVTTLSHSSALKASSVISTSAKSTQPFDHSKSDHSFGHASDHVDLANNYSFTFSSDLASVQSLSSVFNSTYSQTLDTTGSTFKTTVGLNDKNVQAVLSVSQTFSDSNIASTSIYSDKDGDGLYVKNFDIQVEKVANARSEQQKFTINSDGSITETAAATSAAGHNSPPKPHQQTEVLNKATIGNVTYITETQTDPSNNYHFEVFSDSNGDGTWTAIAHGETSASNVDATTNAINLVGIQNYLADASAIVS